MKRIYYLLAFVTAIAVFSACNPLKQTYDQLGDIPKPVAPAAPPIAVTITLGSSDYALSSLTYAKTSLSFKSKDDAVTGIPSILAGKYPTAANKSTAVVTYGITNPSFAAADSLLSDVAYTVTTADYTDPAGQKITGTTFKDYSDPQVLLFLKWKYPNPVNNQLVVLTYNYYQANVTPSAGIVTTDSFGYLNGSWVKLYQLTPAEYASIGRGTYAEFSTGDDPAVMNGIFNTILKNDPNVAATAKVGDVKYVTYTYYVPKVTTPATPAYTFQRIQPLTFDGANWTTKPLMQTLNFSKSNGVWFTDNTTTYTLTSSDFATIGNGTFGSSDAVANLKSHNNFQLNNATIRWTDAQIAAAVASILKAKYTSAVAGQKFAATFATYGGYTTETYLFIYNGTDFVYQPAPDPANYTLTGDDYDNISKIANIAPSAAATNLQSFGDFSLSGASIWTDAQINAGIIATLKARFPTAAAGQTTVVTYAVYSGGNKVVTRTFKFDGTNWTAQ